MGIPRCPSKVMPNPHTPTCRTRSTPRVLSGLRLKKVALEKITSPKLLGGADAAQSTLPYLVIPTDQARLIQALYPPVLTPHPDDTGQYLALTNIATIQWLLNGLAANDGMPTTVSSLVVECPGWTIEQLVVLADYLGPRMFGWHSARDGRACHRALRRVGLPIPREPLVAELMKRSVPSPKAKHGR